LLLLQPMAHIYSMTGFGKTVLQLPAKKITIELKSLNSKQTDLNVRVPNFYREKEANMRQLIAEKLQRGKIDLNLYCEVTGPEKAPKINEKLVSGYLNQLKAISLEAGIEGDYLAAVMRLPDVLQSAEDEVDEEEWAAIQKSLLEAVNQLMEFRKTEGGQMLKGLEIQLANITSLLEEIDGHEENRLQRVKDKLNKGLAELAEKPDANRYEQELIYYLEKLDINEEKVRLKSHLKYFDALLKEGGVIGKKLGFVAQEMGREINTMGAKANHAEMQKLVVEMKDQLEKIKEQVLNIL